MRRITILLASISLAVVPPGRAIARCAPLAFPVDGPVVAGFAPIGSYGGHWGVDFGVREGTPVRAAGPGRVSFAGDVAGRSSVTVLHGGGVRTSYSYLAVVSVSQGGAVGVGAVVGVTGPDHGGGALHFSLRTGDRYVDPMRWLGCGAVPGRGLRLLPPTVTGPMLPSCDVASSAAHSIRHTWPISWPGKRHSIRRTWMS